MIEAIMYFGIGFLVATLLGLLFIPLLHNRAVRLTMKRPGASTPLSMVEIRADRDHLRAEFAISTRRLEMTIEELKVKTPAQLAELGKKTNAIKQLKKELAENKLTSVALEARDKKLRDQLRATEKDLRLKSSALLEADRQLAHSQAELAKMWGELGKRSLVAS
jgi:NhaP-type Na+/H+ and K+/H+ antiporter